jgi:HK97 family phage portal protein
MNNIVDAKVISQTAQQMDLLASRGFSVAEVARITGVPKAMLMDDSGSSYNTPAAATQEFLLRTIQPKILEWENELNSKLLGAADFGKHRFHLCERLLHRLDPSGQAQIDKIRLETGVKCVNELRAQYDLPTIEGGDIHYISTNLAEIGSEKLKG